jgi:hypothetical protein
MRSEAAVERIGIIGPIADEPIWQGIYEAGVERGGDESHVVRRSRGGTATTPTRSAAASSSAVVESATMFRDVVSSLA